MSTDSIYRDWQERGEAGLPRALSQSDHESINASHCPGTLQLCAICEEPTGRCEDDSMHSEDESGEEVGPLCVDCLYKMEPA